MKKHKHIKLTNKGYYREVYYNSGQLWYKAFFIGSALRGYYEYYYLRHKEISKRYYAR